MSLNCFSARAVAETDSELEAASKSVERTFKRMQLSEKKRDSLRQAIKDIRASKAKEMEAHLQWLMEQKSRLEQEIITVNLQLEEKRMRLDERNV
ncbi:hypothetical protein Plhal304r1_c007g0028331 [Plasmopara halstedii]